MVLLLFYITICLPDKNEPTHPKRKIGIVLSIFVIYDEKKKYLYTHPLPNTKDNVLFSNDDVLHK